MTKQEFDKASTEAGFGPCADYMWDEIEKCYSTSDDIDRDLMVYIYWNEPGIYRDILYARWSIMAMADDAMRRAAGYRFPEARKCFDRVTEMYELLDKAVAEAKWRAADAAKAGAAKAGAE